jgi:uncharacterized membrane protein YqiK
VRVQEARAAAIEKKGAAEAAAIREKLQAEATGLAEKAAAMKALDGVGRDHEEFRLRLDKDKEVELQGIEASKEIATQQAAILKEAFASAKINIVGGDGQFFDKFINAVSLGKSLDGAVNSSRTLRTALSDYTDGSRSMAADVKDVLSRPALDADAIQKLTLSAVLGQMMTGADGGTRKKLGELLEKAKDLGLE